MFQGLPRVSGLLVVPPASFIIFVLTAALIRILRFSPTLFFLFLNLRPWRLLLLNSSWRLSMLLYCRSMLLRRLRARASRCNLRVRSWTLWHDLPLVFYRSRFLPSPLGRHRRCLPWLLLDVLADYLVTRLVAVTLAAEFLLLVYPLGILVPCILTLVGRTWRTCRN